MALPPGNSKVPSDPMQEMSEELSHLLIQQIACAREGNLGQVEQLDQLAAAGVIGFVGLIVPHGMRRLFGADQRTLLVSSALAGACLLVLADALARGLAPPREIPIGVITAAVGAPIFLAILTRKGA